MEVSPACIFEGASYGVFVNVDGGSLLTDIGGALSTSFSLTDITALALIPGDVYDWKISSVGFYSTGSFEVECPTTGTISDVTVDTTTNPGYPTFNWDGNLEPPLCDYSNTSATIEITDGTNSYTQSVTNNGDTNINWTGTPIPDGDYTFILTATNPDITYSGATPFTIGTTTTFEITTPQTYYAVNDTIDFTVTGFDSTAVTVTGGGIWDSSAKTFIPDMPGTYTLSGGSIDIDLTVCGYTTDGTDCWIAGEPSIDDTVAGESCDSACLAIGATCVAGIWDSSIVNSSCVALTGGTVVPSSTLNYSPFWLDNGSVQNCTPRDSSSVSCGEETPSISGLTFSRICSCE